MNNIKKIYLFVGGGGGGEFSDFGDKFFLDF